MEKEYLLNELITLLELAKENDEMYIACVLASLCGAIYTGEQAEYEISRICSEFSKQMVKEIQQYKA